MDYQRSGAPSVAQQALYNEYDRMKAGYEPMPMSDLAPIIWQMQQQMMYQAQVNQQQMQMIQSQQAAFMESMATMQKQYIEASERQKREFENMMAEALERQAGKSPQELENRRQNAMEELRGKTEALKFKQMTETQQVEYDLANQQRVTWRFNQTTPVIMSGVPMVFQRGIQQVPYAVAVQLMQGELEKEISEGLRESVNANDDALIPRLGNNPSALYAVEKQIREKVMREPH